jgi:Fe-S cluster assembly iron-binding protein IscA
LRVLETLEALMLTLTPEATAAVSILREQRGLPDTYGLRVFEGARDDGQRAVQLGFSEDPVEGDEVTESEGTRVFVDPTLARVLDDTVLDTEGSGQETRLVLHAR